MKTTTTTTEASAEDRKRVQGIGDNVGGDSGSTTGLMDWQRQRSVGFSCYHFANSNNLFQPKMFPTLSFSGMYQKSFIHRRNRTNFQ